MGVSFSRRPLTAFSYRQISETELGDDLNLSSRAGRESSKDNCEGSGQPAFGLSEAYAKLTTQPKWLCNTVWAVCSLLAHT